MQIKDQELQHAGVLTNSATSARLVGTVPGQKEEVNAPGFCSEVLTNSATWARLVGIFSRKRLREQRTSPDQQCHLGPIGWDKWETL